MTDLPLVLHTALYIAAAMLVLALFFAFLRMARGPDLPNRVLALDLIAFIAIGIIVATIFGVGDDAFLIVAVVQSLVGFTGTLAVAKHLERRRFS